MEPRATIVVLTHNRVDEVRRTVERLRAMSTRWPVIVVDNGSDDGTARTLAREFPDVTVIEAGRNLGAAGRNLGIRHARTPYVALSDDDVSWTERGLHRAAALLDAHPRLAVVSGCVLVGADARLDPSCAAMAQSPLAPDSSVPGPRLLGFLAGASMVRRDAVLAVGGFESRLFLGSEEMLLAADLAAAGWQMMYAHDVVVHHHPSRARDARRRRRLIARNDVWFAWRRLRGRTAVAETVALARRAVHDADARAALVAALRGAPWAIATRRRLPSHVLEDWRCLRASAPSGETPVRLGPQRVAVPGSPTGGEPS